MDSTARRLARYGDELQIRGFDAGLIEELVKSAAHNLVRYDGLHVLSTEGLDDLRRAIKQEAPTAPVDSDIKLAAMETGRKAAAAWALGAISSQDYIDATTARLAAQGMTGEKPDPAAQCIQQGAHAYTR